MIMKVAIFALAVSAVYAQVYGQAQSGYNKIKEPVYPPQPYNFGYDSNDGYGTNHFRKETGDGNGNVQGSYGYKDAEGVERIVEYVADKNGYRAQIKTNEPGTDNKSPANIDLYANPIQVNYVPAPKKYVASYPVPQAAPQYQAGQPKPY